MKGMPDQTLGDMETVLGDLMSGRKSPLKVHGHRHNLKNRFELKKTLGEGTYGKVKLAVEKTTGQQMAIKYIKKSKIRDEHDLDRIRREIKIMSTLQHQNIVNVKEVFENKDKIILVMECADGGELYDYINDHTLTERDARTIFRNIVSAIKYCHQSGIAHRDLKLENILLDRNNNAKIADFGLSNYFTGQDFLKTYCGSPLYASPEIVNGQPYYGPEVDCWSLGVVLYTLVYGTMPFDGTNFKRLRTQITTGDYYEPDKPSEAAGLIRHLLTVNPAKRATIEDICAHWWVNLGYSVMPDNEPYIPPTVLQPVPSCQNQTISSSSSESDDGEPESVNKSKVVKPLKGILKKPKMTNEEKLANLFSSHNSSSDNKQCNTMKPMSDIECSEKENPQNCINMGEDSVFTETEQVLPTSVPVCDSPLHSRAQSSTELEAPSDQEDQSAISHSLSAMKDVPFNSQLLPKRGILKRKGKFSAGDSGCDIDDSLRKDSASLSVRPMDLSEADSALDSPDNVKSIGAHLSASKGTAIPTSGAFSFPADESQANSTLVATPDGITSVVVRRRKGILKNAYRDPDKRLSACSIGSNSSADFLDFSYDSSEETMTAKFCKNSTQRDLRDICMEVRELNSDLFNHAEAKDVCKKALDLCKDF